MFNRESNQLYTNGEASIQFPLGLTNVESL